MQDTDTMEEYIRLEALNNKPKEYKDSEMLKKNPLGFAKFVLKYGKTPETYVKSERKKVEKIINSLKKAEVTSPN
jgi:hypothetical protein